MMQSAQSSHAEEDVLAQDRTFAVVAHFGMNGSRTCTSRAKYIFGYAAPCAKE